ncbi:hypothetical protein PCASD_12682 [Puccinia coronata f. sp. avenae]|uniref:Uncharacterized protein n=1 Tax=Puccinia coronata f. sp. avenae TaxID=200324 RepID=A0A2N5UDZ9_9BASI|nr:hypothetical protein PCASD_12682 [Puccinia coronata f. sp. avenae]
MPHAVRTPTNGVRTTGLACGPAGQACWPCTPVWRACRPCTPSGQACTAGTPVRPGSRKPLKLRGLRELLGTLIRVPNGTLIRVPNGTLIRAPRGSHKPLDPRGLREPGRTGVPAVHACPEGVQGLHALQTGVHGQHACPAGPHAEPAVLTPFVGVRTACGMRGFARLCGKACSPRTPFF